MTTTIITIIAVFVGIGIIFSLVRPNNQKKNRYRRSYQEAERFSQRAGADGLGEEVEYVRKLTPKEEASQPDEEMLEAEVHDPDAVLGLKDTSARESKPAYEPKLPQKYVKVFLLAPSTSPYSGYELLQSMLANGLRFGKHKIFHRYEQKTGRGDVLFSLASAQEPGTFELSKMGAFTTPALTLFFDLSKVSDPLKTYEMMIETANLLAEDLGGRVCNERCEAFTTEMFLENSREIKKYVEETMQADLFSNV